MLTGLALVSLLVGPTVVADLRDPAIAPVVDLVRILFVLIGLPALVLTTTTPLVSGWFEAVRSRDGGGDPYWLYALSNGGSLLALLAYPLVIEPALGLAQQRSIWMVGYGLLIALLAVAAIRVLPVAAESCATTGRSADGRVDGVAAADHLAATRSMAAARGDPVRPAVGGHDVHRHRPRLGPAAVGRCRWPSTSARSSSRSRRAPRRRSAWPSWPRRRWSPCCGSRTARPVAGRSC